MEERTRDALLHCTLKIGGGPKFIPKEALRQLNELQRLLNHRGRRQQQIRALQERLASARKAADVLACDIVCAGLLQNPLPSDTSDIRTFHSWRREAIGQRVSHAMTTATKMKLEEAQQELKVAKQRIHTLEQSQGPRDEIDALTSQLRACRSDLEDCRLKSQTFQAGARNREWKQKYQRVVDTSSELSAELRETRRAIDQEKKQHWAATLESNAERRGAAERSAADERQMAELRLQCQLSGDQASQRKDERDEARREVAQLRRELERVAGDLREGHGRASQREDERDEARHEVAQLRRELERVAGDLREAHGRECEELQTLRTVSADKATALSGVRARLDAAETELEVIRVDLDHTRGELVAANAAAEEAQGWVAQLRAESGELEAAVCDLRVQLEKMTTAEQPSQDHACGLTGTTLLDASVASASDEPPWPAVEETSGPCFDREEQPAVPAPASSVPTPQSPAIRPTAPVVARPSPSSRGAKRARASIEHTFAAAAPPDPSTLPQGAFQAEQRLDIVYGQKWGIGRILQHIDARARPRGHGLARVLRQVQTGSVGPRPGSTRVDRGDSSSSSESQGSAYVEI
ncbi:hypothetical protein B0H13DRAFT_2128317 [Mycena leptocephala]|nr:hypothetical protein B0H13DRAFT_2128317 [Mycena leptocephala]